MTSSVARKRVPAGETVRDDTLRTSSAHSGLPEEMYNVAPTPGRFRTAISFFRRTCAALHLRFNPQRQKEAARSALGTAPRKNREEKRRTALSEDLIAIYCIYPISGAYPINEEKAGSELVNEVLGRVVKELLRPGEKLHVHELITSLWRQQQGSPEPAVRDACEQAIRLLARKLN